MTLPAGFVIRPCGPEDAESAARLLDALNAQQGDPTGNLTSAKVLADGVGPSAVLQIRLAWIGALPVGVAAWHGAYEPAYAARGSYLVALWVDPPHRRCGIGRALVDAVAAETRTDGGVFVWWVSKPWNTAAHATYSRLGAGQMDTCAHALAGDVFADAARRGTG
ncbi:GNAT family N-acetyltransferase [Amorphus orientalis]|uniref:Diamine N-acetyltransferase n=1 Tax=Amorphus orientalis TaxID=649198 RepID=A0AAE3VRA2_9HYPH|nr:GNAT family N-acetyltransferase [Amorphus orientalis]MDQ0316717.1 diamine N-acetyltransferase [Amorphus orientalis]